MTSLSKQIMTINKLKIYIFLSKLLNEVLNLYQCVLKKERKEGRKNKKSEGLSIYKARFMGMTSCGDKSAWRELGRMGARQRQADRPGDGTTVKINA